MKILAIEHIQIATPESSENVAREFYVNVLGFTEIPKPLALANRGGVWFKSENVQLHLGVEKDFHSARKAHPAFLVDNLDEFISKAKSLEIEIDTSPPELEGFKRAHIFDPFGNRIELMEVIK